MSDILRIPDVSLGGAWLMVNGEVNIEDLCSGTPGRVIRIDNSDSLKYIPAQLDDYERVAGMISDAA
jgi:hypothetical protein